jgi:hypothetical protein
MFMRKTFLLAALSAATLIGLKTADAQDCDQCAVSSYMQQGFLPNVEHHAAFQFDYGYRHHTYQGSSKDTGAPDEKVANTLLNLFYSHRIADRFFIDANLPFVSSAYTLRPNNTFESDRDSALGDMSLLVTGQPYLWVRGETSVDWRIRAGVKLPTGDSKQLKNYTADQAIILNDSSVYSYDRAAGSGSTDWIVGSSIFLREDRLVGFGDVQYIGRTEGENSFQYGDKVTLHLSPGYVFYLRARNSFSILADSSYVFSDNSTFEGSTVRSSGESSWYLGPRILATFGEKLSAMVGVGIPIYHDMNGRQLANDYRITAGIMVGL